MYKISISICMLKTFRLTLTTTFSFCLSFSYCSYVHGIGSETRNSLFHLHNGRDMVMVTTCRHGKSWRELQDNRCDEDNREYDRWVVSSSSKVEIKRNYDWKRGTGSLKWFPAVISFKCNLFGVVCPAYCAPLATVSGGGSSGSVGGLWGVRVINVLKSKLTSSFKWHDDTRAVAKKPTISV